MTLLEFHVLISLIEMVVGLIVLYGLLTGESVRRVDGTIPRHRDTDQRDAVFPWRHSASIRRARLAFSALSSSPWQ